MSGLTFPPGSNPAASPPGLGVLPVIAAAAVVGGGAYGVSALRGSSKKKRRKRRARAAQQGRSQVDLRQIQLAKFTNTLKRIDTLRYKVASEVRRGLTMSESLARSASLLGDTPEAEQFLIELGQLQSTAGDIQAAISEYEVIMPRGDEPSEFLTEMQPQAEAGYKQLREIGRQARALMVKANRMAWQARKLLEDKEEKRIAAEVAIRAAKAKEIEDAAREARARQARMESQRDLEWESQLQQRREWNRRRRRALSRNEADPGRWTPPVVEDVRPTSPRVIQSGGDFPAMCAGEGMPEGGGVWLCDSTNGWINVGPVREEAPMQGMNGWFSDLFGSGKKKAKKRAKRAQRARIAAAEQEKERQAKEKVRRTSARLRVIMRDLNGEASAAAGWVARIRRMVNETPDLPLRMIDDTMANLSEWESVINEVRAGVGELDLGVEDPREQQAYVAELQAALASVRTIRVKASALREQIETQVRLVKAQEIKLQSLRDRERELSVRDKVLQRQAAGTRGAIAAERAATERARIRRVQVEGQRILASERQRLAEELRFLRQLERRGVLLSRSRA